MSFDASIADITTPTAIDVVATPAAPTATPAAPAAPAADTTFDIEAEPVADAPVVETPPVEAVVETPAAEVPEVYADFTAPEGVALDPVLVEGLKTVAKELKLTQDGAQKLADLGVQQVQAIAEASAQAVATEQASWLTASRTDPEIGGDKLKAVLGDAKTGLAAFGSPQIAEFLRDTKLNTHPEFIKLFAKLGKLAAEDGFVPSTATTSSGDKSFAERLYPSKKGK